MDGTAGSTNELMRQHLIDPEICIRCNTCEEICPEDAITHNAVNYVIDFDKCTMRGDCLPPCPTGAIDSYRKVTRPWTVDEQFEWDELPSDAEPLIEGGGPVPDEVEKITAEATASIAGQAMPPWSAAHPYVSIYTREAPIVATVAGNMRLTEENASQDIHHIVLDLGHTAFPVLEGQSIGILPPGEDEDGKPHHVRLYSIASPREGERVGYNNLALTVKRVVEDNDGNPVHGVASNYLCDLKKGDKVKVCGPYGTTYLMPNHPGANIIMVCTGTGSAPMRAMTERRRRKWVRGDNSAGGKMMLFFGARTEGELPYFGPLLKLPKEFLDVNFAFSREKDQEKKYVQDVLSERGDRVGGLLKDDNTYIYICGHKRMEDGVEDAFREICRTHELDWDVLKPQLIKSGRYHVETYY